MAEANKPKHFVLVHGLSQGAWTWYKLIPLLESTGHWVTVLDLAASGINKKAIQDVHTFYEYTEPLLEFMASIPSNEKVILVGHSLGGLSLALAMDKFPEKILVAVFVTAFMPDTIHQPSYVLDQYCAKTPTEAWLDSQFLSYGSTKEPSTYIVTGPKFLKSKAYHLSPVEDGELATILARPGSLFIEDLCKAKKFSNEGYGSVKRVYVVCNDDKVITEAFQRWMIENSVVKDVMEIKGVDHVPMTSKPQELCNCLSEIALKYA